MENEFFKISNGTFTFSETENENQFLFYRNDGNVLTMDFYEKYIMYNMIERMVLDDDVNINIGNKNIHSEISDNRKSIRVTIGDFSKNSNAIKKANLKRLFHKIFG